MFLKNNLSIYQLCNHFPDFQFNHIVEVGIWKENECRSREFIMAGKRVQLFEPHPVAFNNLKEVYEKYENVSLHKIAVSSQKGSAKFTCNESSSFLSSIEAPPCIQDDPCKIFNKNSKAEIEVECDTFNNYDDGTIDLLLLDMEGAEYNVLQNLKSRPRVIAVETHSESRYTNSNIAKINEFMNSNTYKVLFRNTSDSFFIWGGDLGWGNGGNDNWKL